MSTSKYDLVVFGATGFTGEFVVQEIARTVEEEKGGLTWAIAGRSMSKLQAVLAKATEKTGKNLEDTPIIIADIKVESTLLDMAKQARVVLNCVGPYTLYGDMVVRACLEAGTHHLDISGESYYLEKTQLLYNGKAKEANVYVIGSCGIDCIPSEMGIEFTKDKFKEKGDLNAVETHILIRTGPKGATLNTGTWNSAIQSIAERSKVVEQRKQLYPNPMPKPQHPLKKRGMLHFNKDVNSYCIPFPGVDRSVVYRTQRYNFENKIRRVQFQPYFRFPSLLSVIVTGMFAMVFGILANFGCGRWLLRTFPRLFSGGMFSHKGPTEQQIEQTSTSFTFVGSGYPSKVSDPEAEHEDEPTERIVTRVSTPEPAYVATSICLVQCGYVLLAEADKLPKGGGVLTPGAAFAKTNLIERLDEHGIKFSLIEQESS